MLDIIPEQGGILTPEHDDKIEICGKCRKELRTPFFFCGDRKQGYCRDCELGTGLNLCKSIENRHEHFNIIEIKHETG